MQQPTALKKPQLLLSGGLFRAVSHTNINIFPVVVFQHVWFGNAGRNRNNSTPVLAINFYLLIKWDNLGKHFVTKDI